MHGPSSNLGLISWLTAGAPHANDLIDLAAGIAKRLRSTGINADQFALYATTIHPEMPGNYVYWTEATGARHLTYSPEHLRSSDVWVGCAAHRCVETERMIVHTIGKTPEFDVRPESRMFLERGYKQFVYTPLHSSHTLVNSVAAYGTKREGGFSEDDIDRMRNLQGHLARVAEGMVLRESTEQILSTYVGRDAGGHVLRGNILRGDSETIPSVVLFADLRDFTAFSNTRPVGEVIERLNRFFEIAGTAIYENGGEILKFLGDGFLAIFPTPDDVNAQLSAAADALTAIEVTRSALDKEAGPIIRFRAALHVGDIFYGNIGSKSRMDFTAIGATVNLAARLLDCADALDADVVCSDAFHRLIPDRTASIGDHFFKGFEDPQPVFRVDF